MEMFVPIGAAVTLLLVAAVLLVRRIAPAQAGLGAITVALLAIAAAAAFWRARRHFVSEADTRALLDYSLGLRSRLSAASAGVGEWPQGGQSAAVFHWKGARILVPLLACAALLVAAFLVPISSNAARGTQVTAKPPALAEVEEWLERLEQEPAVEPESVAALQEQTDEIAHQDPEKWYSHASLEASEHLRQQLGAGLRNLDAAAAKLESLLADVEQSAVGSEADAAEWKSDLQAALAGLDASALGLDARLAQQLREIDPSKLRAIDPERLRELQKQLRDARGVCKECLGEGEAEEYAVVAGGAGRGGVNRGPGTAPLTLNETASEAGSTKTEAVSNEDLSRAAPGDLLAVSAGEHEVDRTVAPQNAAGGRAVSGAGADAVWNATNLPPDEQQRLRAFFQ